MTILNSLGKWHDAACGRKCCAICNVKYTPVFEMRGLCIGTSFDKHFSWTGEWDKETEHYYFEGMANSFIQWNEGLKEWRMTLYQNETIYGICNETDGRYPFGMFDWHFFNDTCKAEKSISSQSFKHTISFSGWYQ